MFPLLNCCVEAAVNRLPKFLVGLVPGGGALIEVVEFGADVWELWTKQKPAEAARREELQALAHASAERVGSAVQAAIQAEAAGQPPAVKRKLTTLLIQVQVSVRRTLSRPDDPEGRTVPTNLRLNSAEDLRPFLPPQLPRFVPGDFKAQPPRRGVPGWVWLAASTAAFVIVVAIMVVVVFVVQNWYRPNMPDGPPIAAQGPGGNDRPKRPLTPKDADAEQKTKKKVKTDTPEKPAQLPRLAAFPKLPLPQRGTADLQVKVDRQGYAGPIKVQVENLPPGVTCKSTATIPAGKSALQLEFRTDGTAAEGTATVEVMVLADTRAADRQKLALLLPPMSIASAKRPELLPKTFKNSLGIEFALVPKGKSWLGGGSGKPGNKVVEFKQDFYLGKFEVTQEQWQAVMRTKPSYFSRTGQGKGKVQDIKDEDLKQFPVEMVSYEDAKAFVTELNKRCKEKGWVYRLPTEAEWEYACRGGPMAVWRDSAFDWYFDRPTNKLLPKQANFDLKRTCKVGSYPPNRLGLHDMHGNIWEWCYDALADLPGSWHIDKDAAPGIVERGGCWHDGITYRPLSARISFPPTRRSYDHGLRVARVPAKAVDKGKNGPTPSENGIATVAALKIKLKSPAPGDRKAAVVALARMGAAAASADFDLCYVAVFDPVPVLKKVALEALEKVQPKLYPLAVTLILPPVVSGGQASGYVQTLKQLPAFGRAGLPLIAAQLTNPNLGRGQLVSGAYSLLLHSHANALAAIASNDDDALKLLLYLPESPLALKYLAASPGSRSSLDGTVGQHLQAIGKANQKARQAVVPYFIKRLASTSAADRQRAADALGSFGPDAKAALPALRQRKLDPAERVRNAVRVAIANIERDNK